MSGYIGNIPTPQATQTRDVFTATAGQTSFATSGYTPGFLDVYLNGVHLVNGTDYTASNGSDVVLSSGATAGDNLEVVAYTTFQTGDFVPTSGGTFTGNLAVTGDVTITDKIVHSGDTDTAIRFSSNDTIRLETGGATRFSLTNSQMILGFGDNEAIWLQSTGTSNIAEVYVATNPNLASYNTRSLQLSAQDYRFLDAVTFTERVRIDNTGRVGINTSSPLYTLDVNAAARITSYLDVSSGIPAANDGVRIGNFGEISLYTAGTFTYPSIAFSRNSTTVGSISTSGTSTSYNTSSDYRLKENVVPLEGAAARLAQIPVYRFNFTIDPDTTVDGFLAHEVQDFVPEAVAGEKDEVDGDGNPVYQGIDQSKLVPLLTAALQEALARIETLEAEVAALKGA